MARRRREERRAEKALSRQQKALAWQADVLRSAAADVQRWMHDLNVHRRLDSGHGNLLCEPIVALWGYRPSSRAGFHNQDGDLIAMLARDGTERRVVRTDGRFLDEDGGALPIGSPQVLVRRTSRRKVMGRTMLRVEGDGCPALDILSSGLRGETLPVENLAAGRFRRHPVLGEHGEVGALCIPARGWIARLNSRDPALWLIQDATGHVAARIWRASKKVSDSAHVAEIDAGADLELRAAVIAAMIVADDLVHPHR